LSQRQPVRVHRILRERFSANPFDGEGSFRFGGRWSSLGQRVVYTSEHLSLAMLEYLAHLDEDDAPDDLVLATVEIPNSVSRLQLNELPDRWWEYPAPEELARIGDNFVREAKAAILIVPSVIVPSEFNWILNPAHSDFNLIAPPVLQPFSFDSRLITKRTL
jgi:RES domain-containing protein